MEVRLVVEQGRTRRVFQLPDGITTVGRSRDSTLRLPFATVSRSHCRLYRKKAGFVVIEDLHSANGTRLNDEVLLDIAVVRPGDRLKIGPVAFIVEYELTPDALESLRKYDRRRRRYPLPRIRRDGPEPLPAPESTPQRKQRGQPSTELEP